MALLDGLLAKVTRRTAELADGVLSRAEAAFAAFPDVRIRREGDTLVLEAMGLARRWMNNMRLRFSLWGKG